MQNAALSAGGALQRNGGDFRRDCIICEQTPSDRLNTHMYASMLMAVGSASNPNVECLNAFRFRCDAILFLCAALHLY